jgi:hypothetical protein
MTILAASASAVPVSKSQRELLLFIANLAPSQPGPAQAFYNFVEFAAQSLATTALAPQYNQIHVVTGSQATLANLVSKLSQIAGKTNVKALDLIFVTHGLSGSVAFSNGTSSITTVSNAIKSGLTAAKRAKLRMVFSTACYGASHNAGWLSAGFKAASGSKKIYADSALSFPAFLGAWALNMTFSQSVSAANLADAAHVQDTAAKGVLFAAGYSNWSDVDSTRVVAGNGSIRISTMP